MMIPEKKPTTGFEERSLEYGERSFFLPLKTVGRDTEGHDAFHHDA